ncbi:hypothetical protein GUJ93_ZPchr0006g43529 [Zizania palustris]|uniref:Rx N-terminal domain-containing protein n=1 Tax=Zizania palustris TaxID=103762 RepID=A0A8J5T104_ZIZPA|nr:hypothetical protein GUJ93_ZPchr0006g43529 [Zizania palustris]
MGIASSSKVQCVVCSSCRSLSSRVRRLTEMLDFRCHCHCSAAEWRLACWKMQLGAPKCYWSAALSVREGEGEEKMAGTVVSMALSLLGSAISKASSAAAEEMSLIMNVRTEIWYIKDELKTMQAFLNTTALMKEKNDLLKVWVGQVRDLAYDIEDCLDEFRVHLMRQSQLQQLMKLKHHHRIAIMIRSLKSRVEDVSNRNGRYKLIDIIMPDINTSKMDYTEDIRNLSVNNIDEGALLGLDGPKAEVLRLLDIQNNIGPTKVVSVVGMGGLGKTTLVKKVSESNSILKSFSRHAWITILEVVNIKRSGLKIVKELGELTQLRKLGLVGVSKKQGKELSAALDKLPYLRSLRLDSGSFDPHWLGSIPTLPLHLHRLKLMGHLSPLPSWVAALINLRKIYLSLTCLVQDDLRVLGTLPNLMHLQFDMKSYIGEKLLFYSGAFPILRTLQLYFPIQSATEVAFEKGASPKMERITIRNCDFTSGITGIGNLPNLQEISLKTDAKVAKLDSLEREMNAHPNHPVLTMWMSRSEHDLGDEEVFEAEEHSTRPPFHEVGQSSQSGAGDESMYNSTTKLKRSQSWRTWTAKTSYH